MNHNMACGSFHDICWGTHARGVGALGICTPIRSGIGTLPGPQHLAKALRRSAGKAGAFYEFYAFPAPNKTNFGTFQFLDFSLVKCQVPEGLTPVEVVSSVLANFSWGMVARTIVFRVDLHIAVSQSCVLHGCHLAVLPDGLHHGAQGDNPWGLETPNQSMACNSQFTLDLVLSS